jgi:hypothetical protein
MPEYVLNNQKENVDTKQTDNKTKIMGCNNIV